MTSDNLDLDAVREPLTRKVSEGRSRQLDDVPLRVSNVNRRPETVRTIARLDRAGLNAIFGKLPA
jgi:hypothetical protein